MDASVRKPPADILDLLLRIFPAAVEGGRVCRPFVASVAPVKDDGEVQEAVSTIVDSVTGSEACLLHSQPLVGKHLEICVSAGGGEVMRMTVEVVKTASRGPLVETIARFLR